MLHFLSVLVSISSIPTSHATSEPSIYPTIAPSINCEVLKIDGPNHLISANDAHCNIDLDEVFESYWLQSNIPRSHRPSFTLDCDDDNNGLTTACDAGYSGIIFYLPNQWEIQINSNTNDCFKRFVIEDTAGYSLPLISLWTDVSTSNTYLFQMECTEKTKIGSAETGYPHSSQVLF